MIARRRRVPASGPATAASVPLEPTEVRAATLRRAGVAACADANAHLKTTYWTRHNALVAQPRDSGSRPTTELEAALSSLKGRIANPVRLSYD